MLRLLGLCVFLLAACGATPGELSHEYGKAVRKVGLFPVYPPREEFQIGDVYMWSAAVDNPNDSVRVYVDSMDWLRGRADAFMSTRVVFQNTIQSEKDKPARTVTDIPSGLTLITRAELGNSDLVRSLPIAAFPRITADAGFTAGLGIVQVLAALGLAGGARTQVDLNFNDVRTYWVPNVLVGDQANGELEDMFMSAKFDAGYQELERMTAARLGPNVLPCKNGRRCGLSVITRVYLTRKIEYTYRNTRIIAAGLRSAEPGVKRATVAAAPSVTVNVASTSGGGIDAAALDAAVTAVRQQIETATASEAQGASLRFEAWDARGMTFASEYMRPVVVGWDGVTREF